jgi:hypothetical protein
MFGKSISLTQKVVELQQQLDTTNDKLQTLLEENADHKQTISAFMDVKQGYEDQLVKVKKEYENKLKVAEQKLKETELSVNQKVNESLASIGVTNFPPEQILLGNGSSDAEVMDTFNTLSGPAKTAYYQKHKVTLSRALGI